jgi:hypothetical protein
MTRSRLTWLAALAALSLGPVIVAAQDPPRASEIVTTGLGSVSLPPDRAILTFVVEGRGNSAAAASAQHAARLAMTMDALERAGFPRDSIRRESYVVGPDYDYADGRKLVGYEARSTLRVAAHDLARLGTVIDAAIAGGASRVLNTEFASDTAAAARSHALSMAYRDARADAEALAAAAGGRLGEVLSLSTSPRPRGLSGVVLAEARIEVDAPQVARNVVVAVEVEVRWRFVPGS